jgi:hypothetical protein
VESRSAVGTHKYMQRQHKYQYWYSGKMLDIGQIEFFTDGSYRVNDELIRGGYR